MRWVVSSQCNVQQTPFEHQSIPIPSFPFPFPPLRLPYLQRPVPPPPQFHNRMPNENGMFHLSVNPWPGPYPRLWLWSDRSISESVSEPDLTLTWPDLLRTATQKRSRRGGPPRTLWETSLTSCPSARFSSPKCHLTSRWGLLKRTVPKLLVLIFPWWLSHLVS